MIIPTTWLPFHYCSDHGFFPTIERANYWERNWGKESEIIQLETLEFGVGVSSGKKQWGEREGEII